MILNKKKKRKSQRRNAASELKKVNVYRHDRSGKLKFFYGPYHKLSQKQSSKL